MDHITIYRHLYVSEFLEEKQDKILRKLKENRFQPGVYLITFAQNGVDELEFYSTALLKQHVYEDTPIFVVGIAEGYEDAVEMVARITGEVYDQTGTAEIRRYIMDKENQESIEQV